MIRKRNNIDNSTININDNHSNNNILAITIADDVIPIATVTMIFT